MRYLQWVFREGGTCGSTFNLIAATLGSGIIGFAYAIMKNGTVFGPLIIILGALLSYYTGMLIVKCAAATGKTRYEDIALSLFGPTMAKVTSWLNLICLIGFTLSYVVFVRNEISSIIDMFVDDKESWVIMYLSIIRDENGERKDGYGGYFWGVFFTFAILFPMSIPRSVNALRFSSVFGVVCSMYLAVAVMILFLTKNNEELVPVSISDNFSKTEAFQFSLSGISGSFPLVIFAYMY